MDYNYPELYYRIYPKAIDSVNRYLEKNGDKRDISKEDMEAMIDEVYEKMVYECPEIDEDPIERRGRYRVTQRPFYGRRRLVRDIISIILISELIRRINPHGFYGAEY
ncbi:hypothetical protein CULT_710037 [[Clostridium] ultunense Esp]|uniref:Uncharacterized protein n=1 Tax=[Clostridium] ultunense Esp TaxID=1288971 RepID=M1ZH72_9FIRM|nr:hypothetical protein [Schnuerera ultunensis]CCQ97844.1 hypothetical protein CULT_710037 [[Clostridium] ultunense Esp]SHD77642.1 conserved protein of unknown function [[Clostridium] ultunense Esp]